MKKMFVGFDVGNGYMKGSTLLNDKEMPVDIPSCVAFMTATNDIKPEADDIPEILKNIYNQLDASFDTPLVEDKTRRLFGERGILSGMVLQEFDADLTSSKAEQDLSGILILGSIAGRVLQDYYEENKMLPVDMLEVTVRASFALPIREFKEQRKKFAQRLKSTSHFVTIHNFEQPVRISITFEDVQVLAEGAAAQYAINADGEPLMNAMLADLRKMGITLEGITASDILAATNTIGIDIGEGTVNFPVFQNGKFNPDVSDTLNKGYGSVMTRALSRIQQQLKLPFSTRKELVAYLQKEPSKLKKPQYDKVKGIVDEETVGFVNEIVANYTKLMNKVGAFNEVVYVYGGGATPVQSLLYPALLRKAENIGDGDVICPILYLDSRYSRYLNRKGLFFVTKKVAGLV